MARTSVARQTSVYCAKNFRLFMNQKDWKFIVIAGVISFLVCGIVGGDMFSTYENTKSGFFAILSAAIWIGIFNSIQRICKEHDTINSEYRSGLHLRAYVFSHIIFDFFLCLIQSAILMLTCAVFIDFPSRGIIFPHAIAEYAVTLFLVIWCSDIMGIMISSVASTPNAAMTAMPFVLILQLVMSGVLFDLKGWSAKVADITFSKWGMSALGSIADLNDPKLPLQMSKIFPQVVRLEPEPVYDATAGNLLLAWGMILLLGAACGAVSLLSLRIRNRGS